MSDQNLPAELPPRDRLMTRPDEEPLPTTLDPTEARNHPTDPKPVPKGGQGTDPKAGDLDHVT